MLSVLLAYTVAFAAQTRNENRSMGGGGTGQWLKTKPRPGLGSFQLGKVSSDFARLEGGSYTKHLDLEGMGSRKGRQGKGVLHYTDYKGNGEEGRTTQW